MFEQNKGFIDINKYPEVAELCQTVHENMQRLRKVSQVLPYNDWYDKTLYNHGWQVASLRYCYEDLNPMFKFLRVPLIQSAGFSVLEPGAHIRPHHGYAGDVFRIHYGLECPEGDCFLRVDDQKRTWKDGEFFMFNDLDYHEAWNYTDQKRTVMLFDVNKALIKDLDPGDVRNPNAE